MLEVLNTLEEQSQFALLYQIVSDEVVELSTDNQNYVIARNKKSNPVWVWTVNNISKQKQLEVMAEMEKFVLDSETKFTCKKEFYENLKANKFKLLTNRYFEMGTYYCNKTIKPKNVLGECVLAKKSDVEMLATYYAEFVFEIDKKEVSKTEAEAHVLELLKKKELYVWKNEDKKIVCMAVLRTTSKFARINRVYTVKDERNKSYAKALVCALTDKAIQMGYVAQLYTDLNYPASNKAYMAVGYTSTGFLINFSCKKEGTPMTYLEIVEHVENIVKPQAESFSNKMVGGMQAWSGHTQLVRKFALEFASKRKADLEVVELAALLHDYARYVDYEHYSKIHAEMGAEFANQILTECGYDQNKIKAICLAIKNHDQPNQAELNALEGVCLADADGYVHIINFFEIYNAFRLIKKPATTKQSLEILLEKVRVSYNKLSDWGKKFAESKYKQAVTYIEQAIECYVD